MGRDETMIFTPETLIQIYLDGSFTEEAQAEFNALMRRDPVFTEKVTQALAERLGPVSDATVDNLSSRLDGKIGDLWNRHKPSPLGPALKLGLKIALGLAMVGGLFFAGRFGLAKFHLGVSSALNGVPPQNVPGMPQAGEQVQNTKLNQANGESGAGVSTLPASVLSSGQVQSSMPSQSQEGGSQTLSPANADHAVSSPGPSKTEGSTAFSSATGSGQNSLGPTRAPAVLTLPAQPIPGARNASSAGTTMEGNSLRVVIDTDGAQKVSVTVYDANGLLVRHLFNGVLEAGEHNVDWDGKDDSGNVVLPGDYTVILDRGGQKMSGLLKVLPSR
jgi:hypothetical protein